MNEHSAAAPQPDGQEAAALARLERWFEGRMRQPPDARARHAHVRQWLTFLLLRYGALRLTEVFRLGVADMQPEAWCVHVSPAVCPAAEKEGAGLPRAEVAGRDVWLPPAVAQRLAAVWREWEGRWRERPLAGDASQMRRCLRQAAKACQVPAALASARALRCQRGLELERLGLHPALVNQFLGRDTAGRATLVRFDRAKGARLLRERLLGVERPPSSARNLFSGCVREVRERGLLADVLFMTDGGCELAALITTRSARTLALAPGARVSGSVKALWVAVQPLSAPPPETPDSPFACFGASENKVPGTVATVTGQHGMVEVIVNVADGQVCAVQPAGALAWLPGASAVAIFSAAAMTLMKEGA